MTETKWNPPGGPYRWPPEPPHELECASVTTILKTIPKPGLERWLRGQQAYRAIDEHKLWTTLSRADAQKWITRYVESPARDRGTLVHAAVETYLTSGKTPTVDPDAAGYVQAAIRWAADFNPDVYVTEGVVFSRVHAYAGTTDLVATIDGRTTIVDFKTGRLYPEAGLQLTAYSRGDFIGLEDGTEYPLPKAETGLLVKLNDDGTYEARWVELDKDRFALFLAAKGIYEWQREHGRRVVGSLARPLRVAA